MIALLTAAAIIAGSGSATPVELFGTAPVGDASLAESRGMTGLSVGLTERILRSSAEIEARNAFRFGALVPAIQMDVWWGTQGSQLIAGAVRNQ